MVVSSRPYHTQDLPPEYHADFISRLHALRANPHMAIGREEKHFARKDVEIRLTGRIFLEVIVEIFFVIWLVLAADFGDAGGNGHGHGSVGRIGPLIGPGLLLGGTEQIQENGSLVCRRFFRGKLVCGVDTCDYVAFQIRILGLSVFFMVITESPLGVQQFNLASSRDSSAKPWCF
jgi:hypothetical protein